MGGSISSLFDGRGRIVVPDGYETPGFPSLYLPSFDNTQDGIGVFLYEAQSIWRFTLYWTLILIGGTFLLCSLWASFTLLLSLTTYRPNAAPLQSANPPGSPAQGGKGILRARRRMKRKRPPFWPLIALPFFVCAVAALVALISGTVVGFALAAVYSAGGFTMSTWVPFLWGLIQVIVMVISSYSTLTSIL